MEISETNQIINDACLGIPLCTCGKCVIKRSKKDHFHSLPYSSKLSSMYQSDFGWREPKTFKTDYLKATHSAQENSFKKNINNCLISTAHMTYRPFKVSYDNIKCKTQSVESVPFYGSSTYENTFINYGSTRLAKGIEPNNKDFKVTFRGKSSYTDYAQYPQEDYLKRNSLINYKPTLKFVGDLAKETEFKDNYLPVDFKQPAYFGGNKLQKGDLNKHQMIPCPFPKSNFESISRTSFEDHFAKKCQLREYMVKTGVKSIEI